MKRELVRALADRAERIDRLSVLKKRRIAMQVRGRLSRMGSVRRDDAAYALDEERVSRRQFLKVLGLVGAGAIAGSGAVRVLEATDAPAGYATHGNENGSTDGDFEEIVVDSGDEYRKQLEPGETWSNTLIDISNSGAEFRIIAHTDDFEILNLGIRGQWDHVDASGQTSPFTFDVPSGGSGVIENVCWDDGDAGGGYPEGATGIFGSSGHAGRITIRNVNLQGFADNAIYASSMGNPSDHTAPGAGGTVAIEDSYCADCFAAGFRIGTDGSYVENSVMYNCDRAFTGFFQHTEVIDSDMTGGMNLGQDISVGGGGSNGLYTQGTVEVTVENSRFDADRVHMQQEWADPHLHGEPAGPAERTEPSEVGGVPLSPEEAAGGEASGEDADVGDGRSGNGDDGTGGLGLDPC